ncbi:MAG: FkbM family methyltransferase [Acetatifactor sp.]|nr:FkbM family methyltransferase [Acetatifactor sp.]
MQKVIAYGIGRIYKKNEKQIREKYNIIGLMDKNAVSGTFYHGIPYLEMSKIGEVEYDGILITALYSRMDIVNDLRNLGVSDSNILFYFDEDTTNKSPVEVRLLEESMVVTKNGVSMYLEDDNDNGLFNEIFCHNAYNFFPGVEGRPGIMLDIGMNAGIATLYFASMENIKAIYSFEPFKETYDKAVKNIQINSESVRGKIKTYNIGLSDRNYESFETGFSLDASTAMRIDRNTCETSSSASGTVSIRKFSDVFRKIHTESIAAEPQPMFICKVDCEGSEYPIFKDMEESGILKQIDLIILETHDGGEQYILSLLRKYGYVYFSNTTERGLGMVYAVNIQHLTDENH